MNKNLLPAVIILVLCVALFSVTSHNFFFWDNIVQLSIPANYYYSTNFSTLYLPNSITTGHQPFAGMYLALGWKLFGRSLAVSHALLMPFVFGAVWYLFKFVALYCRNIWDAVIISGIALLDACFISQLSMLTFETIHLCFFFASLYYLKTKNWILFAVMYAVLLGLISSRASISGLALLPYLFYTGFRSGKATRKTIALAVAPGIIFLAVFLVTFYNDHGWIIHNTVSNNWSNAGKAADMSTFLRNTVLFLWRMLDFGRVIFYLYALIFFFYWKRIFKDRSVRDLLFLAALQLSVFFIITVPSQNTIAHRYLLPFTVLFGIMVCLLIINYLKRSFHLLVIVLFLISGYFWIYPEKTAKGWDALPASQNYFGMNYQMLDYLRTHNIKVEDVGSSFPNGSAFSNTYLSNTGEEFPDLDFNTHNYILYSNVFNESDEVIDRLFFSGKYRPEYVLDDGLVHLILFKKK